MFLNSSSDIFSFVYRQVFLGWEDHLDPKDYLAFASYAIIQVLIIYNIFAAMRKDPNLWVFLSILKNKIFNFKKNN